MVDSFTLAKKKLYTLLHTRGYMSDTPRTDALEDQYFENRNHVSEVFLHAQQLERELAEAQEELNDKRKFCYDVEKALEGMKGDYVEIIVALRKDAAIRKGE